MNPELWSSSQTSGRSLCLRGRERKSSALLTERLWPKTEECVTFNKNFWGRGIDCRGDQSLSICYYLQPYLTYLHIYHKRIFGGVRNLSKGNEYFKQARWENIMTIIHKGMKALTSRARWQF